MITNHLITDYTLQTDANILAGPGQENQQTTADYELIWKACCQKKFGYDSDSPLKSCKTWSLTYEYLATRIFKFIFSDGTKAEKKFNEVSLCGQGIIFFPFHITAKGEFKDNLLNGQGAKLYPTGRLDKGKFENHLLNGPGIITYINGKRLEGDFENNQLVHGKITFPNQEIWEGDFKDHCLQGFGKKTCVDKVIEQGFFNKGNLIRGKFIFPNDEIWEGHFKNGDLEGQGKAILFNGILLEGLFKEGKLDGKGKITYPPSLSTPHGKIIEGNFKAGHYIDTNSPLMVENK